MNEHIISSPQIWSFAIFIGETSAVLLPFILLVASLAWIYRIKVFESYLALLGTILVLVSRILYYSINNPENIAFGSQHSILYQNPIVFFFYIHGYNLGLLFFAIAVAMYFLRGKRA